MNIRNMQNNVNPSHRRRRNLNATYVADYEYDQMGINAKIACEKAELRKEILNYEASQDETDIINELTPTYYEASLVQIRTDENFQEEEINLLLGDFVQENGDYIQLYARPDDSYNGSTNPNDMETLDIHDRSCFVSFDKLHGEKSTYGAPSKSVANSDDHKYPVHTAPNF